MNRLITDDISDDCARHASWMDAVIASFCFGIALGYLLAKVGV